MACATRPRPIQLGGTSWSGEIYATAPDFFVSIHAKHLVDRCPEIIKYWVWGRVGGYLPPDLKDVWFDPALLNA